MVAEDAGGAARQHVEPLVAVVDLELERVGPVAHGGRVVLEGLRARPGARDSGT